jgi:hypothetical protein
MPGIVAKRWLTGLLLCQAISCFSKDRNRSFDLLDLCGEHLQHLARKTRQTSVLLIADDSNQLADIA